MPAKAKPVHQVRLGNIKAAVWRNETESGTQFNVTFERLFKKGDEWQSSDSTDTCCCFEPEATEETERQEVALESDYRRGAPAMITNPSLSQPKYSFSVPSVRSCSVLRMKRTVGSSLDQPKRRFS